MIGPEPTIERAEISALEPPALAAVRELVESVIPQVTSNRDRRGFRLLQWPPIRPNAAGKPIELSLEHEVRLRTDRPEAARALAKHLSNCEGRELFPACPGVADLIVRRVERAPGAQSVDRYWDVPDGGFAANLASLRQRVRTSKFMTWSGSGGADTAAVFNLELPLVALGRSGVVARLEFNWIDDLATTFAEFDARRAGAPGDRRNPLVLARDLLPKHLDGDLKPIVEHTTFREKYSLRYREGDDIEREHFQMNIDHMMIQSLASGHFGYHCDIDVAAAVPVDETVLFELDTLATTLVDHYSFRPANAPKYWWDRRMVDQ